MKYALYVVDVRIGMMVALFGAVFGWTLMFMHVMKQTVTCLWILPPFLEYSVIQKDGLKFVRLYSLNYTWYVNNLHNIWKRTS